MDGVVFIIVGSFNLFLAYLLVNETQLVKKYIHACPKTAVWKKFIKERTAIALSRTFVAPLEMTLGAGFLMLGLYLSL